MTCSQCNADYSGEQCPQCAAPPPPDPGAEAGQPATGDGPRLNVKADDEQKKPPVGSVFASIKDADVEKFIAATDRSIAIGKFVANYRASERPPTLFDHLEALDDPQNRGAAAAFDESELSTALRTLERERLLLIVCSDREVARTAGEALLTRIEIANRRVLSFNALPPELIVDVHGLTRRPSRKGELLLFVDAYEGRRADAFVDSLFAEGAYGKHSICTGLRRVRIRVACIASEENLTARIPRLEFGHWMVSSARILLRNHFPERAAALEEQIAAQRRAGNWSRSPSEFRQQIDDLIRAGELLQVVDRGGPLAVTTVETGPEQAPVVDGESALSVAVLYTATYYPNLSPAEFGTVVEAVVGDQRTLVPETIQQKTKDGSFKQVELKREKRIAEIWSERTDAVLRECRLITSREAGRAITFPDIGRRDLLRRHLDERYGVYVHRQFVMAWEKGLLFDRSSRIASAVISLTVDMALADPDQFGREWLTERIIAFCESGRDVSLVLRRTSDLLRTMLRHPPLDGVVNGVVQRLLQLGQHTYALAVVKSLRRAPEFDDLYWLQQIVDRGTEEVRGDVLVYLFNELRRADSGIHRYVTALADKWLPAPDRPPSSYSHANGAALLTVFAYCFETTEDFDAALYGVWPSRFPIIAGDRASAASQFRALLRCLFHPGLIPMLDDAWEPSQFAREVARLLSKWVFILYGVAADAAEAEDETSDFTRDDALSVLVAELLAVTNGTEGRAMRAVIVDEWEWAKEIYLHAPSRLGDEGVRRRHEFGRKRRLMHDLISEFRRQQRAEHKTAPAQQATA